MLAGVGEGGVTAGLFDHLDAVGAERQRHRVGQRRGDAHLARGGDDLGAAVLGLVPRVATVADVDGQAHRHRVQRLRQRLGEGDAPGRLVVVVVRAPIAEAQRRAGGDRVRLEPARHHRGEVDVRLERGAWLAQRVGRPVELARTVVAAADDGAHQSAWIEHHRRRLLGVVGRPVLAELVLDDFLRVALQGDVEAGAHRQHSFLAETAVVGKFLDLVVGVVEIPVRACVAGPLDRRRRVALRGIDLPGAEVAGVHHVVEHVVGARAGGRQVDVRRVLRRRLEQAGDHRRLRQGKVAHRLAEIELRGRLHAEGAAAEIGAVEIEAQDFALRQVPFEPKRQKRLVDLAPDGALVRQEKILGELLGERGAALHHAVGARVHRQRPQGADHIDAEMLEETAVLGGDHRVDEVWRQLVEGHGVVVADAAATDFLSVLVEEGDGEVLFLQPVLGGQLEGRRGQRQDEQPAGDRKGETFAADLNEGTLRAREVEPLHEQGEALIGCRGTAAAAPHA